jgi:hypothetical protein
VSYKIYDFKSKVLLGMKARNERVNGTLSQEEEEILVVKNGLMSMI